MVMGTLRFAHPTMLQYGKLRVLRASVVNHSYVNIHFSA